MRRLTWRQDNPADQMVAILSGISGYSHNLAIGLYSEPAKIRQTGEKLRDLTSQLLELVKLLPTTQWPNE